MLTLDARTLRTVQLTELELLEEADRICQKHRIHYNIIAGTLLGAVRHGGFIPWDDDADIALLRPEYEKFRKACKADLDTERFYFQDHRNTQGYRWGYGKLRRKGTVFLREHQEHMPYAQGIFIDIFPLDAVPDNYLLRSLVNMECFFLRKLLWAEVGKESDKSRGKRALYGVLSKIPESRLLAAYNRRIKRSMHCTDRKMVRILTYPCPNRHWGYLREWYEHSKKIEFEGRYFLGIKDYEAYLTFKFGDYQELPPKEERKTHPVSRLYVNAK